MLRLRSSDSSVMLFRYDICCLLHLLRTHICVCVRGCVWRSESAADLRCPRKRIIVEEAQPQSRTDGSIWLRISGKYQDCYCNLRLVMSVLTLSWTNSDKLHHSHHLSACDCVYITCHLQVNRL